MAMGLEILAQEMRLEAVAVVVVADLTGWAG